MKAKEILGYLSYIYEGNWDEIYAAIKRKQVIDMNNHEVFNALERLNYITITDANYPDCLKAGTKPPFVLYYKGDISLLKNQNYEKCLSVVGSRNASNYGREIVTKIINELPKDFIIVSGLAKGIDSCAHEAAINSDKKTIAVLANGINDCYPSSNRNLYEKIIEKGGLILSEYPNNVEASKDNFLIRNRLIALFGKSLLVGEAHLRSGTSVTISHALSLGKDVGCIPYHANEKSACNLLIKDGAYLIENKEDIFTLMGLSIN